MNSLRPYATQNLHNYPKIHIDRGNVIRPCNAKENAADQFIDKSKSTWRKVLYELWHEGIPFILKHVSDLSVPQSARSYRIYLVKFVKYIALLLLYAHRLYLFVYGYFFPYALMPLDDVCDEFLRCPKWSESVTRAFAWHPNYDRCALAVCNDYIYVYHGATRIRVLRHAQQRKITDMIWQPTNKEVLIVATQTHIVLWRIADNQSSSISFIRDNAGNPTYLAPGLQLVMRNKEPKQNQSINGSTKINESTNSRCDTTHQSSAIENSFKLIANILPPPIVSLQFDQSGKKIYACSPNSAKVAILNVELLFGQDQRSQETNENKSKPVEYMFRFGQGLTRLLWSPKKDRLATLTTSSFIRVFEPFGWSSSRWSMQDKSVQDIVWSKPSGRMLLIATKTEPCIYALPFLDNPQTGDVGGNKSVMKALDLKATRTESGDLVGGLVKSFAWDKNGKRLAISFRDNPESILLYRTNEKPTLEFHQLGIIQSENGSAPLFMEFHDNYKNGALLTVCWSDGKCQHIPMSYVLNEHLGNETSNFDTSNRSFNQSSFNNSNINDPNSPNRTPRSLTNFCQVYHQNSLARFE